MVNIELKGVDYKLPTDFSEVTLGEYMKVTKITTDKNIDDVGKMVAIISILTGMSENDIREIKISHIKMINNNLGFLFQEGPKELIQKIKIKGKWYGFNQDLNNQSFGEAIDIEQFTKDINNNLHLLMAVLYRPIKSTKPKTLRNFIKNYIYKKEDDNYSIEDYDTDSIIERADIFKKEMKLDVVLGAMFFFISLKLLLVESTKQSTEMSKKEMMDFMMKKMKEMGIKVEETTSTQTGD